MTLIDNDFTSFYESLSAGSEHTYGCLVYAVHSDYADIQIGFLPASLHEGPSGFELNILLLNKVYFKSKILPRLSIF